MKPITRADMNGIKKDLNRKGKLLSITDKESCLAVSCFLRDLFYNFTTIIELEENTDPFAIPSEEQLTMIHRLFRAELRKKPYNFKEADFKQLYRQTMALSDTLYKMGLYQGMLHLFIDE